MYSSNKSNNNNEGLNHLKKVLSAMIPLAEKATKREKEIEEANQLDAKIKARTNAYLKDYYKKLDD